MATPKLVCPKLIYRCQKQPVSSPGKWLSLDEIIKSVNSETNNKPPGNDGLAAEFCKHFWNELAPVLLDVYEFGGKLDTMGVTYRTEIIFAIYEWW